MFIRYLFFCLLFSSCVQYHEKCSNESFEDEKFLKDLTDFDSALFIDYIENHKEIYPKDSLIGLRDNLKLLFIFKDKEFISMTEYNERRDSKPISKEMSRLGIESIIYNKKEKTFYLFPRVRTGESIFKQFKIHLSSAKLLREEKPSSFYCVDSIPIYKYQVMN